MENEQRKPVPPPRDAEMEAWNNLFSRLGRLSEKKRNDLWRRWWADVDTVQNDLNQKRYEGLMQGGVPNA